MPLTGSVTSHQASPIALEQPLVGAGGVQGPGSSSNCNSSAAPTSCRAEECSTEGVQDCSVHPSGQAHVAVSLLH